MGIKTTPPLSNNHFSQFFSSNTKNNTLALNLIYHLINHFLTIVTNKNENLEDTKTTPYNPKKKKKKKRTVLGVAGGGGAAGESSDETVLEKPPTFTVARRLYRSLISNSTSTSTFTTIPSTRRSRRSSRSNGSRRRRQRLLGSPRNDVGAEKANVPFRQRGGQAGSENQRRRHWLKFPRVSNLGVSRVQLGFLAQREREWGVFGNLGVLEGFEEVCLGVGFRLF